MTGGFYWFPAPAPGGLAWSVVTCHDLLRGPDAGHDADLWPRLIDRLAAAWGRDARTLGRRLRQAYTGLPRGRVTRPGRAYLILHGDDAPVPDWQARVIERFHLSGHRVTVLHDEHETMIPGHPRVVEKLLGIRIDTPRNDREASP